MSSSAEADKAGMVSYPGVYGRSYSFPMKGVGIYSGSAVSPHPTSNGHSLLLGILLLHQEDMGETIEICTIE